MKIKNASYSTLHVLVIEGDVVEVFLNEETAFKTVKEFITEHDVGVTEVLDAEFFYRVISEQKESYEACGTAGGESWNLTKVTLNEE